MDQNHYEAFQAISDAIVIVNVDGLILYLNPAAERLFGYQKDALLGRSVDNLLPIRFVDSHKARREEYIKQPRKRPMGTGQPLFGRHQDGHEFPVEISLSHRDSDTQLEVISIIKDRSLDSSLETQLRLQSAALEASANAIVITNLEGQIIWTNPAFTTLTGYTVEEALGKNPRILSSGAHQSAFFKTLWETILAGNVWRDAIINRRKDGGLYTEEMTITPVKDFTGEVSHFIAIKHDITEQVAREKMVLQLYESERQQREISEALYDVSTGLTSTLEVDGILDSLLHQIDRVVPFDSGSVLLLEDGLVRVARHRGFDKYSEGFDSRVKTLSFPLATTSHLQWMVETGQPLVIADTLNYPGWVALAVSAHIRAWVGAPISAMGQMFGFLSLDKTEPNYYQPEHARYLAAFAGQAALALQNARLFAAEHRRIKELEALRATAADISAELALSKLLRAILERAAGLLGAAGGELGLYDEDRGEIEVVISHYPGDNYTGTRLVLGEGAMGYIAQTRAPLIVADYTSWEGRSAKYEGVNIHPLVGAPLMVGNRLVGVITVADPNAEKTFDASNQRLLMLFAQQAAIAVENARLFEAVQQQAQEAETLYQATREAAERRSVLYQVSREISSSLQPEKLYQTIHQAVEQLMPCEVFAISLLNDELREIEAVYLSERGHRYPSRKVSPGQGLSGHIISSGEPLRSGDFIQTHAHLISVEVFGEGTAVPDSVLAVPMRLGGKITGMLSVQSFQPDAYRPEDQEALEVMAVQAAIALNNARLFQATHRQLEELHILNAVSAAGAAALQEDSLLEQATQLIGSSLYPDNFGIMLVDEARGVLRVHHAYRGLPTGRLNREEEITIQLGEGICGGVALTGVPQRLSDVTQETAYLNVVPGMLSELCVPIKVGRRVIGVVNAESKKPDAFSEADERLLVTFASQLATAIHKVRLFEEVKELAITDPLTGLYNRRYFFEQAAREFARARRYERPLAALMLDLDRFKRVNDTYGHAVGDQVLQAVARICRRELRQIDFLARYGGEEFIALLPESELAEAGQVAQRLCDRIAAATFDTNAGPVKLTVSLGVAALDINCAQLEELLKRADHALYQAKQAGRNRASMWSE